MLLSVNRVSVFGKESWETAFARIRACGYDAYETWQLGDKEMDTVPALARAAGVRMTACCPNEFGLNDLARHDRYERELAAAIVRVKALGGSFLITQAGEDDGRPVTQQMADTLTGLRRMAPLLEAAQVTLLLEPLNTVRDHPTAWLNSADVGCALVAEADSPQVRLLYDVYHMLHMGEDVYAQIEKHMPLIAYLHLAGFPARDQNLFEGFDYPALLRALTALGFDGVAGLEFFPDSPQEAERTLLRMREAVA